MEWTDRKPVHDVGSGSVALERHYSVPEIALMWSMSEKSVRRLFDGEPGILVWGHAETRFRRAYVNLRIPESVLIRVHQRRQQAS